ncbi:hypothetical protein [Rathayibacter sp. AY1D1]|uniref:hypothetical protein n=1 Tax=Rathayibacter sp. AY1D1 TaxID=2080542 RepID=UPI0011B055F5|nr:hypothetical protein [Rathayibacter sp. AY1D1]
MDRHSLRGGELIMRNLTRIVAGSALAVAFSLGSLATAQAATEGIPSDVQAAYSTEALEKLRTADETLVTVDETGVPDFSSASSFGTPHQVNLWSSDLISGKASNTPTSPLEEWLAPILGPDGEPVGTYRVWRPTSDSKAELAGYNDDTELVGALQALSEKSVLVSDPTFEAWYAVSDGSVSALNESAAREVPYTTSLNEVASIVSTRFAESIKNSEATGEGAAGGMTVLDRRPWYYGMDPWMLGAGAFLLLASAAGAFWRVRANRQALTSPHALE